MAEVDSKHESPSAIAARIFAQFRELVPSPSEYEVLCFCAEMLGIMSHSYPMLKEDAKRLLGLVYKSHYLFHAESNALPGQPEGKQDSDGGGILPQGNGTAQS